MSTRAAIEQGVDPAAHGAGHPANPDSDHVTLLLGGDVMTGRGIDQVMDRPLPSALQEVSGKSARHYVRLAERANGPIAARNPAPYIWGDALDAMARVAPDLCIVNLGTAITAASTAWVGKDTHFRMSPQHVGCLAAGGIRACSLANDHLLDWDYPGLRETLSTLRDAGIPGAGAGLDAEQAHEPARLPLPGGASLLLFSWATPSAGVPAGWAATATRPGIALLPALGDADAREIGHCVRRYRRPGDLVVVSLHWGTPEIRDVAPEQREFAHRLVELGVADVVHGHSAREALPMEVYRGKLILYGCGDVINDLEGVKGPAGAPINGTCLYAVTLARVGGDLQRLQILPFQLRRFQLCNVEPEVATARRLRLAEACAAFGTSIAAGATGLWNVSWHE
jgi:poly-gamma-glutamate synthesis protein (capsule biosynthesis protein)